MSTPENIDMAPEASCCFGHATNGHESCTCPGGGAYRPELDVVLGSVKARAEELGHVQLIGHSYLLNAADGLARVLVATRPGSPTQPAREALLELAARIIAWERSL